jgi:hypothetical protein
VLQRDYASGSALLVDLYAGQAPRQDNPHQALMLLMHHFTASASEKTANLSSSALVSELKGLEERLLKHFQLLLLHNSLSNTRESHHHNHNKNKPQDEGTTSSSTSTIASRRVPLPPPVANRLDCFNESQCVVIRHVNFGRSGNRLMQLRKVETLLSQCSGAALSSKEVTDDVVRFPSMQVFRKAEASCFPAWDRVDHVEHLFGQLWTQCQAFEFSWDGHYEGMRCAPQDSLLFPPPTPSFQRIDGLNDGGSSARFPSWLTDVNLEAWAVPLPHTLAVMHFRGGDIFWANAAANDLYTQPVCDHYLQSFRHSGATCALLIAEDNANPCVAAVEASLSCVQRAGVHFACGPVCAFTLLARARLVIASFSTFLNTSLEVFVGGGDGVEQGEQEPELEEERLRVYFSYCNHSPSDGSRQLGIRTRKYCSETDPSELFPWSASARQVDLLRSRPARVVVC